MNAIIIDKLSFETFYVLTYSLFEHGYYHFIIWFIREWSFSFILLIFLISTCVLYTVSEAGAKEVVMLFPISSLKK